MRLQTVKARAARPLQGTCLCLSQSLPFPLISHSLASGSRTFHIVAEEQVLQESKAEATRLLEPSLCSHSLSLLPRQSPSHSVSRGHRLHLPTEGMSKNLHTS